MDRQAKAFITALLAAIGTATGISPLTAATVLAQSTKAAALTDNIPPELEASIVKALGWEFHSAKPKSRRAHPLNHAHQTTWFVPYWFNRHTHKTSYTQPAFSNNYLGDDILRRSAREKWKAGGPPRHKMTPVEEACAFIEIQESFWS